MLRDALQRVLGESRKPTRDEETQLVLQGARLNTLLTVMTIPGVVVFSMMLSEYAPTDRLVTWAITACLIMAGASIHNLKLLQAEAKDHERLTQRLLVSMPFENAAIGAVTLVAFPDDAAGQLVMLVMIVVAMAGNVITRSSTRSIHYAAQLPLALTAASGYVIAGSPVMSLALTVLGYCLVAGIVMSRVVRAPTLQSLRVVNENEELLVDLHQSNLELQRRTETDSLTGLLNRLGFVNRLEAILGGSGVEVRPGDPAPEHIAVLFVDLNRFKAVNDSLGHAAGDELLIEAATRLKDCVRPTDVVARIGGDELTIAAPGIQGEDAVSFAERVSDVFDEPFEIGGAKRTISASIGVAYGFIADFEVDDLLAGSDAALYAAKDDSTSHIAVFDDQARSEAAAGRQMRRDLVRAFDEDQFLAYWQPVVCSRTGRLIGVEGLARWNDHGRIRPAGHFIEALTQAGLDGRLSDVMVSEVAQARRVLTDTSVKLGLNVTPSMIGRLLERPDLTDLWPGIVVEITEHELIGDLAAVHDAICEVRNRGADVYLDDFGTGYSSLSLLADLEIDGLKIDRHFVHTIDQVASYQIVADIAEIGRRRGYPVVAEGIETPEQLHLVESLGIELAQGFLFGRPMALNDVVEMVGATDLPWSASFADAPTRVTPTQH